MRGTIVLALSIALVVSILSVFLSTAVLRNGFIIPTAPTVEEESALQELYHHRQPHPGDGNDAPTGAATHDGKRAATPSSATPVAVESVRDSDVGVALRPEKPNSLLHWRPFPRWGTPSQQEDEDAGINIHPILDFILHSASFAYAPPWKRTRPQHLSTSIAFHKYTATADHRNDMNHWFPETLYVWDQQRGLHVSRLHRTITEEGKGSVKDKLLPVERIMVRAWRMLRQHHC
jgi:hypothetical protein